MKGKVDNASTFPNPDLWKANDNTVYVVFMNAKHDWVVNNGYCAEHSAFVANGGRVVKFIVIPYLSNRTGCHSDDRFGDLTFFVTHEISETVTDPAGIGWYAGSPMTARSPTCAGTARTSTLTG